MRLPRRYRGARRAEVEAILEAGGDAGGVGEEPDWPHPAGAVSPDLLDDDQDVGGASGVPSATSAAVGARCHLQFGPVP